MEYSKTELVDLILEQLARNRVFLSDEGLQKLRSSFIIIVGCGGVGSHAAAALARSGCSKLRLIDFDQVTLSSLNRHSVATLVDVGTPKVHAIRKRLEAITPWVQFDCRNELFSASSAKSQLGPFNGLKPDYIIDAIDNIDSKVALLHYCYKNSIKVISSMGSATKSDPTRIFIGDISATTDDPLSKITRIKLRALGVQQGIPVVFSSEKWMPGKAELLPLAEEEFSKGNVEELGVLQNFRVRILPVLGTMPAIFGLSIANHVMLEICDYPHEYLQGKYREKMHSGILGTLVAGEQRLVKHAGLDGIGLRPPLSTEDVGYLIEDIFHGKSVISELGTRLVLMRWRKPVGPLIDESVPAQKVSRIRLSELVCMTKEESLKHERLVLLGEKTPEEVYDKRVLDTVCRRLQEEERLDRYR
jgi:tRNA A37 threonylcarbamoyladenosine dehydratase